MTPDIVPRSNRRDTACEAIDRHTRWHLALLDAGIPEAEAHEIIATVAQPETRAA